MGRSTITNSFDCLANVIQAVDITPTARHQLDSVLHETKNSINAEYRRAKFLKGRGAAVCFFLVSAGIILGVFAGHAFVTRSPSFEQAWPYFLGTALIILVASVAKDRYFERSILKAAEDLRRQGTDRWDEIRGWLEETLQPGVFSKSNREEVLTAAAELLRAARREEDQTSKFVVYLGSASLDSDLSELEEEDDEEGPLAQYRNAVSLLEANNTRVVRYIRLLDADRFWTRGPEFRRNYQTWIERQISLLAANPNYKFVHSRRALPWGSTLKRT